MRRFFHSLIKSTRLIAAALLCIVITSFSAVAYDNSEVTAPTAAADISAVSFIVLCAVIIILVVAVAVTAVVTLVRRSKSASKTDDRRKDDRKDKRGGI